MEEEETWLLLGNALSNGDEVTLISLLTGSDIDIDYRDVTHDLQTLLMRMCYSKFNIDSLQRILETMFDLDPKVNIQDSWGRTALMHACIANQPIIIEGLVQYEDTDVGLVDFEGNSCLTYALQNCDIHTLEDIVEHSAGPQLLTTHNSKGQSPYSLAMAGGDKAVCSLFKSYVDKTVSLQRRDKKRVRRRQNPDVVSLPLTNSPSLDRKVTYSQPRDVLQLTKGGPVNSVVKSYRACEQNGKNNNNNSRTRKEKLSLDVKIAADLSRMNLERVRASGKSESAPSTRRDIHLADENVGPALALTSAKLSRRHHKRDCLLRETLTLRSNKVLPPLGSNSSNDSFTETTCAFPENSIRRQRRPSLSLPDLRNMTFLVNSGTSTPTSGSCDTDTPPSDESEDSDQVFAQSYPNTSSNAQNSEHDKSKRDFSKVILPDINGSLPNLRSARGSRNIPTGLTRNRKLSNSDDQLQRVC